MLDLSHHFLVATPALQDIFFKKSVIYICEHSEHGAMGIIINKLTDFTYGEIMQQLELKNIDDKMFQYHALSGGPVEIDHGFVLHNDTQGNWKSTLDTGKGIRLSSSLDILADIAQDRFQGDFLIGLGYSGWSAGQLEEEITQNAWLTCPADPEIIFMRNIEDKFEKTCERMGINWNNLSSSVGHA